VALSPIIQLSALRYRH